MVLISSEVNCTKKMIKNTAIHALNTKGANLFIKFIRVTAT